MNFSESYPDYFGDDAAHPSNSTRLDEPGKLPGLAEAPSEPSSEGSFEHHWLQTLAHVLTEEIQELYCAEKLLLETLPVMTSALGDPLLRAISEAHLEQTQRQVIRLERIQKMLSLVPDGRTCLTMEGLLIGLQELVNENKPGRARDEGLVSAARKIKQFEIAGYCGARDFAQLLGLGPVADILQKNLDEESTLDSRFANLEQTLAMRF